MKGLATEVAADPVAVEKLVNDNIRLAHFMAAKWQHLDPADALSIALEALQIAAETWNPARDIPFGSYAGLRMRWLAGRRTKKHLAVKRGRDITFIPLDAPLGSEDHRTVSETIAHEAPAPWEAGENHRESATLLHLLPHLRENWRIVLERRFGLTGAEPETLEAIGQTLHLTRERIRQIEVLALAKLRNLYREAIGHECATAALPSLPLKSAPKQPKRDQNPPSPSSPAATLQLIT